MGGIIASKKDMFCMHVAITQNYTRQEATIFKFFVICHQVARKKFSQRITTVFIDNNIHREKAKSLKAKLKQMSNIY